MLEQLSHEHELPREVLGWRRLAKLKSTYLDALPPLVSERTGRLHPTFLQTGAATGRLASSNPNVQNIPIRTEEGIRIREAFVPAEGRRPLFVTYLAGIFRSTRFGVAEAHGRGTAMQFNDLLEKGAYRPTVTRVVSLEGVPGALRELAERRTMGRVVARL